MVKAMLVSFSVLGTFFYFVATYWCKQQKYLDKKPYIPIFKPLAEKPPYKLTPSAYETVASRISRIVKYGFSSMNQLCSFDNIVVSYDNTTKVPQWVLEKLTPDMEVDDFVNRSLREYWPDDSSQIYFRYENDKAVANDTTQQGKCGRYMLPKKYAKMMGHFIMITWSVLRKHVRKMIKTYPTVYCCTGPLYLPNTLNGREYVRHPVIGKDNVAVPNKFFRVLVMETPNGQIEMDCVPMLKLNIDSRVIPKNSEYASPDAIEKAVGIIFFDNISRSKISKINGVEQ